MGCAEHIRWRGRPAALDQSSASPTSSASLALPSIENPEDIKLLFSHGADYGDPSDIWISNLDGSGEKVLIEERIVVSVVGIAPSLQSGHKLLYYLSVEGETGRAVWSLDLQTGESCDNRSL